MLVKFFATFRQMVGCESCDVPAPPDVLALLHQLAQRWPEAGGLLLNPEGTDKGKYVSVAVNGRYIDNMEGVATPLEEADVVALTPMVAGG